MLSDHQMRKKKEAIVDVEEIYSKTEQYVEDNKNNLSIILVSVVAVVVLYFAYYRWYIPEQEKEAQSQMFIAELYFRGDSLKRAVYGDGNYVGFLDIITDYDGTPSANLAEYYAGICLLNLGEYEEAIEHLSEFTSDDFIIKAVALGAIGDANMELGRSEEALDYYLQAADHNKNEYTSPMYLLKAGMAAESLDDYQQADQIYSRLMDEFPKSEEGQDAVRYQARAKVKSD